MKRELLTLISVRILSRMVRYSSSTSVQTKSRQFFFGHFEVTEIFSQMQQGLRENPHN